MLRRGGEYTVLELTIWLMSLPTHHSANRGQPTNIDITLYASQPNVHRTLELTFLRTYHEPISPATSANNSANRSPRQLISLLHHPVKLFHPPTTMSQRPCQPP
jgi:hypothetical protein